MMTIQELAERRRTEARAATIKALREGDDDAALDAGLKIDEVAALAAAVKQITADLPLARELGTREQAVAEVGADFEKHRKDEQKTRERLTRRVAELQGALRAATDLQNAAQAAVHRLAHVAETAPDLLAGLDVPEGVTAILDRKAAQAAEAEAAERRYVLAAPVRAADRELADFRAQTGGYYGTAAWLEKEAKLVSALAAAKERATAVDNPAGCTNSSRQ